jgi:hypothetical protein
MTASPAGIGNTYEALTTPHLMRRCNMAAVILSRATKTQGRNLSPPTNRNPAAVYLASLQPTGRRAMAGRLRTVADLLGIFHGHRA